MLRIEESIDFRQGSHTIHSMSVNNPDSLRVLVLATSYPLGPQDSSSVFLRYLCDHLQRQGAEVQVLAPADQAGGDSVENGVHVHRFRYMLKPLQRLCYGSGILPNLKRQPWLWLVVPFFLLAFLLATATMVIRVRPHIIHGHWVIPTGVIGLVVSKFFGKPFVITAHGGDAFSMRSGLLSRVKRFVVRHATAWTANTNATAQAVRTEPDGDNCHIFPMGVDTGLFNSVTTEAVSKERKKRVLFIGRLVEKKGATFLLDAVARLPQELRAQLTVDIVGEGDQKPRLVQQAVALGIDDIVNFIGYVENAELPRYLHRADLFIGPSVIDSAGDTEGQGVVFLEAMACGVPVIASRVGGIAEVIEEGSSGVLVSPGDARALASAIQALLEDDEKRSSYSRRGLEVVSERFAWERVAGSFLELYRSLVSTGKS